jgi:FtsP/CotA-like multicopper oxidase with cupredoxin domain
MRRLGWLMALALVGLALSACGGMDDDEGQPAAETTTETETTETATTTTEATTTIEAEPEGPRQIRISYRGGKLSGDSGTVRVRRGDEIKLTVRADVEEEVHVHGFDLSAEVAPGHAASINFVADQKGAFIIELEHLQLHIAKLRVS